MILKIAVCDDNDKDIEIINRELLLLEEKAREKGCTYQIQAFKSGNDITDRSGLSGRSAFT